MTDTTNVIADHLLNLVPTIMRSIKRKWRKGPISGVNNTQFLTLKYIQEQPGAALQDVALFAGVTPATASTTVEELVNRNFIARVPDKQDRRKVNLSLTLEGKQVLNAVLEYSSRVLAENLSTLSADEQEIVLQALQLLTPLFIGTNSNN